MAKLHTYNAFSAGPALNAGVTTTYRVICEGTDAVSSNKVEHPSRRSELRKWLRRQHPADIVRIVLLTIAVGAVIFSVIRLG